VKVVFCIPTLTEPYRQCLDALEASVAPLDAAGIEHQTVFEVGCPYISHARSTMLRKALDAKADAVVFIDHDLSWRPQDLVTLIQTNGDVVAGLYRFKKAEEEYMGVVRCSADGRPLVRPEDGAILADKVPAGFLKVTKEAVDRFMKAYPELTYGLAWSPSTDLFNHGAHQGVWYGEDYAFSRRWRDCGGEIFVVPDLDLTHHGREPYPGNFHRFMLAQPGGGNDPNQ
jgi:glycosyltransferase involved in cell wall biosynthesis